MSKTTKQYRNSNAIYGAAPTKFPGDHTESFATLVDKYQPTKTDVTSKKQRDENKSQDRRDLSTIVNTAQARGAVGHALKQAVK